MLAFICELLSAGYQIIYYTFLPLFQLVLPKHYKSLENEVVLITGGGKGVGRLVAVHLAQKKVKQIILWGRTEETLRATCQAVKAHDVSCSYMVCDVSDRPQVYSKAKEVQAKFGPVTLLINNAGVVYGKSILESKDEEIELTMKTNALSQFWTIKAFVPDMINRNHGHIVNINSMLGYMTLAGAADYCASKHASTAIGESLRMEIDNLGADNVHFTSIHPYIINTEMFAGCRTRFPLLFPPLDKEYVAEKVVAAIQTNATHVLLPRLMYLAHIVTSILPVKAVFAMQKFCHIHKTMDYFHGNARKTK